MFFLLPGSKSRLTRPFASSERRAELAVWGQIDRSSTRLRTEALPPPTTTPYSTQYADSESPQLRANR